MATGISALLTIEQYEQLPDDGRRTELVRGEIVVMPPTKAPHGVFCSNIDFALRYYLKDNDLGRVLINDSGVITSRDPDSVRGPDVAFYSYARLPKGRLANEYPRHPPEAVFEVRSPTDRSADMLAKAAEFLAAGVTMVCIVDPKTQTVAVHHADCATVTLSGDEILQLPPPLDGLSVPVKSLFEGVE